MTRSLPVVLTVSSKQETIDLLGMGVNGDGDITCLYYSLWQIIIVGKMEQALGVRCSEEKIQKGRFS